MCRKKKETDVGKIYNTTDGYFTQNPKIKKPRRVAVIEQRKDDGALAVCKIYSKKDRKGNRFIEKVVLIPAEHIELTEDSIVGSNIIVGTKKKGSKEYTPIFKGDFEKTDDKLTPKEQKIIKKNLGGEDKQARKTNKKKIRRWKKHFKK